MKSEGSKHFFFEKKKQKTFDSPRLLSGHSLTPQKPGEIKVFWLLFFKKVTAFLLP
jgi:hypothetical protein